MSQGKPDEGLFVEFRMDAIQDPLESRPVAEGGKGFPVFKEVPFVRIAIPGTRDELYDQPAIIHESHPAAHNLRFPNAWARFKNGQSAEAVSGTPLKEWPQAGRAHVEQLAYFKIKTVEQLASVPDSNLQHLGPGYLSLRQKAKEFLEQANSGATLRAELEALRAQVAAMKAPKTEEQPSPARQFDGYTGLEVTPEAKPARKRTRAKPADTQTA